MYPLTVELAEFLLSERAERELVKLADADLSDVLGLLTWLRRRYSQAEAAALLDQAVLRRRAASKFPQCERMWFDDEALEQASSRAVAAYRAGLLAAHGVHTVADLGCGIGADTIAMAEVGLRVMAVEQDPVRARLAGANVAAAGLSERVQVLCADWTRLAFAGPLAVDVAFVDPARRKVDGARRVRGVTQRRRSGRSDWRRVSSLHEMEPPLAAVQMLRLQILDILVKVAPGVDMGKVPSEAAITFIAEGIRLREAMLAFGVLRPGSGQESQSASPRQAVVLPGPHALRGGVTSRAPDLRPPQAILYEPNPAVRRAGLVRELGARLDAGQLDPDIAYLTGEEMVPTPFARAWPVERHDPFNLKTLNRWLRELGAGHVIVKKRGSPVDPDAFRRRLKVIRGGPEKTVFLTQLEDRPWMVLGGAER
ncbi:MAG: class I SAM-dependent methyltransferase [Anaerolineae bacterium]